jgi:hypothetical protein
MTRGTSGLTSTTAGDRVDNVRSVGRGRRRFAVTSPHTPHAPACAPSAHRSRRQIRQPTSPSGQPRPWVINDERPSGRLLRAVPAGSGGRIRTYDLWVMRRSGIVAGVSLCRTASSACAAPGRHNRRRRAGVSPRPLCFSPFGAWAVTTAPGCNSGGAHLTPDLPSPVVELHGSSSVTRVSLLIIAAQRRHRIAVTEICGMRGRCRLGASTSVSMRTTGSRG